MATIPINDKFRIQSDSRQWIVQRSSWDKKAEETVWSGIEYHTTLENALLGLSGRLLRESSAVGMAELLVEARRIAETIEKACAVPEEVRGMS